MRKFVEMKKDKPYMKLSINYVVTSDNYMDMPEAVKLYGEMGYLNMFCFVMSEKDDPQNIVERPDLYEPLLKKIDETLNMAQHSYTKEQLVGMQIVILNKMDKLKNKKESYQEKVYSQEQAQKYDIIVSKNNGNAFTVKAVQGSQAGNNNYTYYFLIKKDGFDYIRSPESESNEFSFELFDAAEYKIICSASDRRGVEKLIECKENIVIHNSPSKKSPNLLSRVFKSS